MKPGDSFVAQPIRSLQTMLRVIAEDDERYMTVIPDGIYGTQTTAAVSTFQRIQGIPVTGITDETTWDTLVQVYEPALIRIDAAQPLEIVLEPNQIIRQGERNLNLYVIQAVLKVLSETYGTPPPTQSGVLDTATSHAIASFQEMNGLEQTGQLDKITWKQLALHYPLAFNLSNGI